MITHCGTVWGQRNCSYIYAIFTSEYAYIGETGNLPAARWGSHLSKASSSFAQKLSDRLEMKGNDQYDGEFVYIGLHCKVIDLEPESKRRFARRAIEDALHREFLLNKNLFGSPKALLSTSKPVVRHSFGFDIESFAKHALNLIFKEYRKCPHALI